MKYPVRIDGFEGQRIEIEPPGLFSGTKLLANGQPAPRGLNRNQRILHSNDGKESIATWNPVLMELGIPRLSVDGKTIRVIEPLKWYEWVWSAIPILLVFVGALGAIAAVIAFTINTKIFRSSAHKLAKFAISAAVSIFAILSYFMVSVFFMAFAGW